MASQGVKEKLEKEKVEMIKRMTDYDDDVVYEKLIEHDGNYETIIKEFMGVTTEPSIKKPPSSLNQEIFKQIRNHMDEASQTFYTS